MNATRHPDDDATFDQAARQLHAAAIANVSAATQAQLHQRRHRALAGKGLGPDRGLLRPLAWSGAFALLALAIGLPLAQRLPQAPATAPVKTAPTTIAATTADNDDSTLATLEEDPEMYVWLASHDAIALASE